MEAIVDERIEWLLDSDPSLELQARRDLLHETGPRLGALARMIGKEGWARDLLGRRSPSGHWGKGAYCPKWTCTHYVLYELMQLGLPSGSREARESCGLLLAFPKGLDGGINYARTVAYSDACVNGTLLATAAWFLPEDQGLAPIVDYLLGIELPDGGWNCEYRNGATHSSLHTTVAVMEGLLGYLAAGQGHGGGEIMKAVGAGREFLLRHGLLRSERTGEVIKDEFLRFCFPVRYKYDILRCLDLFQKHRLPYDPRMAEALEVVADACGASGRWKAAVQPGATYFEMERPGGESRWNTLRALRVLGAYGGQAAAGTAARLPSGALPLDSAAGRPLTRGSGRDRG
jgi:hypothetical protein